MKKSLFYNKILTISLLLFSLASCIDPYDITYNLNTTVLIVDGAITDEIGDQTIVLKESTPNSNPGSSSIIPLEKAKVVVKINGSEIVQFVESETTPGVYLGPENFKAEFNKTYQLLITTPFGKTFQSKVEKMVKGTPIKNVYKQLTITGKPEDRDYKVTHNIYLDTDDPAGKGNNYLWQWRLFERQEICRTCEPQERYYPDPFPGRCVKDLPNFLRNTIYDYQCKGFCWEIIKSIDQNIMNDDFSDGKTITGRLITKVPIYQLNAGALIEVRQQSIDKDLYKYMKILIDQNQNSGGLADTPPVSLVGNIVSADGGNETLAGYFRVVDISTYRFWIDRSDIFGIGAKPVGLLGGRQINLEASGADTTRPPQAPCINSEYRTNIRPTGWQDSK